MKNYGSSLIQRALGGEFDKIKDTVRWNTSVPVFQKENLASHQYEVSVFANAMAIELGMAPEYRLQTLEYAMFHDWDELFTGDIGHEVKYNKFNGETFRSVIDQFIEFKAAEKFKTGRSNSENQIGNVMLGEYPDFVKRLVKVCDWIQMLGFCLRETRMGNSYCAELFHYCKEQTLIAIDIFEDEFNSAVSNEPEIIYELVIDTTPIQHLKQIIKNTF